MSVTRTKVWRDLWDNKARTLITVLAIAVGVLALGLAFGLSNVLRTRLTTAYRDSQPAHVIFNLQTPFRREVVIAVEEEEGVARAEVTAQTTFEWKLPGDTEWRQGLLIARENYTTQPMNLIERETGTWPTDDALTVERHTAQAYDLAETTEILVNTGHRARPFPVTGVVRDPTSPGPQISGMGTFFATPALYTRLTGKTTFNQLSVQLPGYDEVQARRTAETVEARLDRLGIPVQGYALNDPSVHFLQQMIDAAFLILTAMGVLSLGLSAFLIINTTNAVMVQQIWQIGVMKTLGATLGRLLRLYLSVVWLYGGLALLLAAPLSALATYPLARFLLDMANVPLHTYRPDLKSFLLQTGVSFAVPTLAALVPLLKGVRITIREALGSHGIGGEYGRNRLERLFGQLKILPRPLRLSLRNTLRRRGRATLTLLTLALSGALFIMVMSVGASLEASLAFLIKDVEMDALLDFETPQRTAVLQDAARVLDTPVILETWSLYGATLNLPEEERAVQVWGVPPDSDLFHPRIVAGRALLPTDQRALLLNQKIAREESLHVGDEVTLTLQGQETTWTIVGLIFNLNNRQRDNFVPLPALGRVLHSAPGGNLALVRATAAVDAEGQERLARQLKAYYQEAGLDVGGYDTAAAALDRNRNAHRIILALLFMMTCLTALVGSLGLISTLSINVVERRREIGMLRAIGATTPSILRIFVSEGVFLGLASTFFALPLSYPGARLLSQLVGEALFSGTLAFHYSFTGCVLWIGLVMALSALASLWPALQATRVSVRQALSYE